MIQTTTESNVMRVMGVQRELSNPAAACAGYTRPRLKNGQFISRECPLCGNGTFQRETDPQRPWRDIWICDGLLDPENDQASLQACHVTVVDGELLGA